MRCANMKCKYKCILTSYIKFNEKKLLFGIKTEIHQLNIGKLPVMQKELNKASEGDSKKMAFYRYCSEKRSSGEKIGPLINEEHEINDQSKMVEIMNSFVKSVLNKKNEDRKFEQLRSNENLAKIAVDKEIGKKRPILFWAGSKELCHGSEGRGLLLCQ